MFVTCLLMKKNFSILLSVFVCHLKIVIQFHPTAIGKGKNLNLIFLLYKIMKKVEPYFLKHTECIIYFVTVSSLKVPLTTL